jgi:two-component system chemotaxis response regulator CheB
MIQRRHIIVIGASAGGVQALRILAAHLPANLNASVFVVQHIAPYVESYLPEILSKAGSLEALHPTDGQVIETGKIYIAPPDHHMLVEEDHILVRRGPKENNFRPSVDALMRSAAYCYGPAVIGIVLTGMLYDGTSGLWSVKRLGGITIIQHPEDAEYPGMPNSVLEYLEVDYQLPVADIAPLLSGLVQGPERVSHLPDAGPEQRMKKEVDIASQMNAMEKGVLDLGEYSLLSCPECGGGLIKITEGQITRYRCHTGHGYLEQSLLHEIEQQVELKLWAALRGMEEVMMILARQLPESATPLDQKRAGKIEEQIRKVKSRIAHLQRFIRATDMNEGTVP